MAFSSCVSTTAMSMFYSAIEVYVFEKYFSFYNINKNSKYKKIGKIHVINLHFMSNLHFFVICSSSIRVQQLDYCCPSKRIYCSSRRYQKWSNNWFGSFVISSCTWRWFRKLDYLSRRICQYGRYCLNRKRQLNFQFG